MKQGFFEIIENKPLTDSVYKMVLQGDTTAITAPGQFVNILLDGLYLRRPISVCDVTGDLLTIIYKVVGKGTAQMSKMTTGKLDVLTGLGNGYDLSVSGDRPVLLGGGVEFLGNTFLTMLDKHCLHLLSYRPACLVDFKRPVYYFEFLGCHSC